MNFSLPLSQKSSPAEKIACFRRLFRGRTNVYPRRFENRRTGKTGYAPACGNEWVRGICEKPRVKCSECPHQNWLPVTDEVIRWHLEGHDPSGQPFVIGVYPMLLDDTCHFLAVDFDGSGWAEDATEFLRTCTSYDVPASLERSRSGQGAHIWIFFNEAVAAAQARRLGTFLLSETLARRPEIGLRSYDRFFPNQDTLPRAGFGNLIALPLQKSARDLGNTVFLEENLHPHPDQWAYLDSIELLSPQRLETIVEAAAKAHRILPVRFVPDEEFRLTPWQAPPSRRRKPEPAREGWPATLSLVLADQIYIPKENLSAALRNELLHLAAFQNPEFYRAQAMRLPVYDKPRIISCAEDHEAHIALPRGCLDDLRALGQNHAMQLHIDDLRETGQPLAVSFVGQLRPEQEAAAAAILAHDTGVLAATTAFGKTVLAAWLIAQRGVNTLVLVNRQQLMEQWAERLAEFLSHPAKQIGRLGGGRRRLTGEIDIALIQSLVRKGQVDDRVAGYGHLIVDECHHLPAVSFELVARRSKARFVTGLSATVVRKDGHHPIITMQCGPVRYRVDAKSQAAARPFTHHVYVRPTAFLPRNALPEDPRAAFQELCQDLQRDLSRNAMITADVAACLQEKRNPIVLTERTEHVDLLVDALTDLPAELFVLRGKLSKRELSRTLEELRTRPADQPRVILATGKFVGEGFDDPQLDTLFLAMPVAWRGTITQYVGRLHRLHEGKREVRVFDYADLNVPMLSRMFDKRCAGYESAGYTILLPGSALPGWPAEVPLPVDPAWKRDYAATIRRLLRDGIDVPLAGLFLRATESHPGPGHPRSAAEAFLHRRLQTLPGTTGLFQLNARLPIPFDQFSQMEVDFYCPMARLALELDGPQHLADEEAYRRDRRKDATLQQNNILILRFLTTDLTKNLDHILDTVLAALESRNRRST
jgi:superfamily II DNA or RNA helicase